MGQHFVDDGFVYVSFNFSHNGTDPQHLTECHDLEAFAKNTFSKELYDLEVVLNWVKQGASGAIENHHILPLFLIGHSRGGPISLITAYEQNIVSGLITWASVATLDYAWPNQAFINRWQDIGFYTVENKRTGQVLQINYDLYLDFLRNQNRFNVKKIAQQFQKPWLIVHGTNDNAISDLAAKQLHNWSSTSEIGLIKGANHVFGAKHPYLPKVLPDHSTDLYQYSFQFLQKHLK